MKKLPITAAILLISMLCSKTYAMSYQDEMDTLGSGASAYLESDIQQEVLLLDLSNEIYRLPSSDLLYQQLEEAGLMDFAKNSKLIENLERFTFHPYEVSAFIQAAYSIYFTYLDNYIISGRYIPSVPPFYLTKAALSTSFNKAFNNMKFAIENRNLLYAILLQDYRGELVRLQSLGVYRP